MANAAVLVHRLHGAVIVNVNVLRHRQPYFTSAAHGLGEVGQIDERGLVNPVLDHLNGLAADVRHHLILRRVVAQHLGHILLGQL